MKLEMNFRKADSKKLTGNLEKYPKANREMNTANSNPGPNTSSQHPRRMPIPHSMRSNKHLIGLVLYNFCRRTTVHGVNHLTQMKNQRGRIFWLFIVSAAALGFTINLFQIVEKYLQYQVLSNTYHDHEMFEFPEISFCNLNPISVPPYGTKAYESLLHWVKKFSNSMKDPSMASFYVSGLSDFLYIHKKQFSNPGWSLIVNCKFQTRNCSWKNFTPITLWPYGTCFTFNPFSMNMSRLASTFPIHKGIRPNLEVILYKGINYPSEMKLDPHHTLSMPSGILYMMHEPESYPFIMEGYALDFFSVVDLKITRKFHEPKLKPCIKIRSNYTYVDPVTNTSRKYLGMWSDCIYDIIQNEVQKSCHCVLEQYPISYKFRGLEFCKSSILNKTKMTLGSCLEKAYKTILKNEAGMKHCYKDLCDHSTYGTVISQAKYPAVEERNSELLWLNKLADMEAMELYKFGKSDLSKKSLINNSSLTLRQAYLGRRKDLLDKDFVERNFMLLRVVAQSLFMDRVEEVEEYPISRLLSDIGGCIGLWLGASLITVFEVFDLILDSAEIFLNNPHYRYKKEKNSIHINYSFYTGVPHTTGEEPQMMNPNMVSIDQWKDDICCSSFPKPSITKDMSEELNCLSQVDLVEPKENCTKISSRKRSMSNDFNLVSSV